MYMQHIPYTTSLRVAAPLIPTAAFEGAANNSILYYTILYYHII